MSNMMDFLKPQLDGMHEMYRVGYEAGLAEGKRQAHAEFARDLQKIQDGAKYLLARPCTCDECLWAEAEQEKGNGKS